MELLAPAGNLKRLKVALDYGADAVYVGGSLFGLRAKAPNFTLDELKEGVQYAHERGKKVFLTLNIMPHDEDLELLEEYLESLKPVGIDAYIVSDPGTFQVIRKVDPEHEVHLSTQANCINSESARFWFDQGIQRVILGRELSLEEITKIVKNNPGKDFEVFVHGAMCMAYSGRCLISNYLTGRDANRGDCVQACRWNYHLVEETRPGEYIPIVEEEEGTAILQAHDLNTLKILPEVIKTGVMSLKIEGRNKTEFYVASVVRVYREALRRLEAGNFVTEDLEEELNKLSHRTYSTGFFEGPAKSGGASGYINDYDFLATVLDVQDHMVLVEQRGKFSVGDEIEIFGPDYRSVRFTLQKLYDQVKNERESAPHAMEKLWIEAPLGVQVGDMIRKKSS
ncbi:peptidase U32 family protein [Guggenheimella bovis]